MASKILILDDDADFNSLLTDIFEQADYAVTSSEDPIEAQELFAGNQFDLVVTDHRMPEMTGSEFMQKVKSIRPEVPVIMVSGYLENDTIRDLIKEGVGGVFLKPLNIFSLLERTAELIEESRKTASGEGPAKDDPAGSSGEYVQSKLNFPFRSFPCKSDVSTAFAEQLYSLRNFKSTLSLIGEKGSHFRAICEDIAGFYDEAEEHFIYVSPASFEAAQILALVKEAKSSGAGRVTCVILNLESMSEEQKALAAALSKREGEFSEIDPGLRLVFCLNGDLDALYEEGEISEQLYIMMGTAEVTVPALRNCSDDIPFMAQQIAVEVIRGKGLASMPRFDASAKDYLRNQEWMHNHAELRETITRVVGSKASEVITAASLASAKGEGRKVSPADELETDLTALRGEVVRAAAVMLSSDVNELAEFFASEPETVQSYL